MMSLFLSRKSRFFLFCVFTLSILACSDNNPDVTDSGGNITPTPDIDCTTVTPGASLADDFVCAHNAIRASVPSPQPVPDPPLPVLVWNQELADFAKAHADFCIYEHSDNTTRTNTFGEWVGENLAANTGQGYDPYSITDLWASEAADYNYTTNSCTDGEQCGHYTQIVWRETTQIGCAKATCPTLTNTTFTNADYWVCEYLPGGNYIGQRPY